MAKGPQQLLIFEVGGQKFGLPAAEVRELLRAVALTPLPRAPVIVEGAINVRGEVVPVLDVRRRFGLPPRPLTPSDHLVVAWANGRPVALRLDRALDMVTFAADEVDRADAVLPGVDYVAGVAKVPDGLVLIHDLCTFLSSSEAVALTAALPAEGGRP